MAAPAPALAEQLAASARLLAGVAAGQSLQQSLPQVRADLRPGVQALVFDALRHWGLSQALRGRLCQRAPPPLACTLLELALGLLAAAEPASQGEAGPVRMSAAPRPAYAAHTLVHQAVAALALLRQPQALRALVNACLRRFERERSALLAQVQTDLAARWNHPRWWIEQLQHEQPQYWQAILRANRCAAPMLLRVNRLRCSRSDYLQALAAAGLQAHAWGEDGVRLAQPLPVQRLPGWAQGWVSVQDGAAQLAAPLLLDGAGLPQRARLLDACAAPGGKSAHLLERCPDAQLLALDIDAQRCTRIADNLQRLGLAAELHCADAALPATWWDGALFDAILLDAPCSASGIVRRHPDVPWLRRASDLAQLAAQQARLLHALWPLLRPGGRLLYATCSVFEAEGAQQVRRFLAQQPQAEALPAPGLLLPAAAGAQAGMECGAVTTGPQPVAAPAPGALGDNAADASDGFFYALLRKRA